MKRFYCTICKRIKRVQSYPSHIENPTAFNPTDRIGECNSHSQFTRKSLAKFTDESLEQIENRFNRSSRSTASFAEQRRIDAFKKVVNK